MNWFFSSGENSSELEMPIKYSAPIPDTQKKGYSAIYEGTNNLALEEELKKLDVHSPWEVFCKGLSISRNKPCLGTCVKIGEENSEQSSATKCKWTYVWKTYQEVDELIRSFGSGLNELCLMEEIELKKHKYQQKFTFIGIGGVNCIEWIVADLAANAFNCTVVPIYQTLGFQALATFLTETRMPTACGDIRTCNLLLKAKSENKKLTLKNIIVFADEIPSDLHKKAGETGIRMLTFKYVVDTGREKMVEFRKPNKENVSIVCYTSGTTGNPKGVMLTNEGIMSCCFAFYKCLHVNFNSNDTHLSYLPLAHIYERVVILMIFSLGARVGFYRGNPQLLIEDMYLLKPTVFPSVPRLFNKIYNQIVETIATKNIAIQKLFHYALSVKVKNYRSNGCLTHRFFDYIVFNKIKQQFGGKIKLMFSGSAPLNKEIQEKLSCIFNASLVEGWGMTETSGASLLQKSYDFIKGTVGGPTWVNQFKIQSVPHLNYFADCISPNNDAIKGELCVRGLNVFKGYLMKEDETNEVLDEDGFLHSGDIVELLPNGAVKIIDRKKNIYKLSQGEYVSPEKIESIYEESSFVSQIFVHATYYESCLVGVVVVDKDKVVAWAKRNNILGEKEETEKTKEEIDQLVKTIIKTKNNELKNEIMNDFDELVKDKLVGFEKVKDIYITDERFTVDNGLLTPTMKLVRHKCQKAFEKEVNQMFENLSCSRRSSIKLKIKN